MTVAGNAGAGTTVVADGNGILKKQSSSRKYKVSIDELDCDADAILGLRPVSFRWKETGEEDIGLIAEEVDKQLKELVIHDQQGQPDAVKYDKVALYLLEIVKELKSENQSLKQRLELLEQRISK